MFNAGKIKNDIVLWIRDYFEKNGCDCNVIIGISGGKDSSVTAALCVQALGASRVLGILLPQGEQRDIGFSYELVCLLGIKHITINIKDSVDAVLASLKDSGLSMNKQVTTNIPSRIRMSFLYAVATSVNGRVANTSNLSEDWVGYSTKFGSTAGDFSPLSCLTSTEVKLVGRELLPSKLIDKIPEDGLSGLTDEENLGFTYDILDRYIREGICEDAAIREKIDMLHLLNKHKLMPMPCFSCTPAGGIELQV